MLILNIKDCPVDPAMPGEDTLDLDNWFDVEDEDEHYYEDD